MSSNDPLLPPHTKIPLVTSEMQAKDRATGPVATRDHALIRRWANRHAAEPATGEETASGAATVTVRDGGAGIRFNFPGMGRFRAIAWEEWLDHFDQHQLTFIYEEPERENDASAGARYRIVKGEDWGDVIARR